jgi:hypothetical protein
VPTIRKVPIEPDFVYRSAKYISRSYEAIDQKYKLDIETMMPIDYFVEEFNKLHTSKNST